MPAVRRASAKSLRKCSCFRLNADLGTGAVCYPNTGYPKLGYSLHVTIETDASEHVECPLCAGRGTARGRAFRGGGPIRYRCGLCAGDGSVPLGRIQSLQTLRDQMQRVANAMQAGDDERAAQETRVAVRLARLVLT